ncbi:MAG: GNAT family N-acetyltransferase [Arcticibacter sp.]
MIKTIYEETEWKAIIQRSHCYDFYHTWYYHSLDKSGCPILLLYQYNEDFIAFPLIRKSTNTGSQHLASAYGYVGPVSNKKFHDISEQMLMGFRDAFFLYLKLEGYQQVTARLSPFLDQNFLINTLGGNLAEGKAVVLDLSVPIEYQRKNYRRNLMGKIRKLERKGYYVGEGNGEADLRTFISIYLENMNRIGATDVYLFNEQYFFDFLKADDFEAKLYFVFAGNEVICATIVTLTNGFINGHLIGTRNEYLSESPAKLLVDQLSIIGRQLGMKYFNLGGGLNFREDQLFSWKSGFSRLFFSSEKWTFIQDDAGNSVSQTKTGPSEQEALVN